MAATMDDDLHEELRRLVQRDYDLAAEVHARLMIELGESEVAVAAALTLPVRDPRRERIVLHWYATRAAERPAGEDLQRCADTFERLWAATR